MLVLKQLNANNRLLAFAFFAFASIFGLITWYFTRPYGTLYFFAWYFVLGLGFPFLSYAIWGTQRAFYMGMGLTVLLLAGFNFWGHTMGDATPGLDWSHFFAGTVGLALGWMAYFIHSRLRLPHAASRYH